jgi:Spy/CpxP family protein refolding chaperone
MNRAIIILIHAIFLTGMLIATAPAQGSGQGMGHGMAQGMVQKLASRQTAKMKTDLNLTADQVQQVSQINASEIQSMLPLFSQYKASGDKQGFVKGALAISKARDARLQQVLSAPQWQAYESKKPERTSELMTQMMALQLNLTDPQISQVEQINLTFAQDLQGEMGSGWNPQGKSLRDKLRMVKDVRTAQQERDQSLRSVLTPEQFGTYQSHEEEMQAIMKEKLREQGQQ